VSGPAPDSRAVGGGKVAIICGGGSFPLAVATALTQQGRPFILLPMRGFAGQEVERFPHQWVKLGQLGNLFRIMRAEGASELVMIGSLVRPALHQIGFDLKTLLLLPKVARAYRGGDNTLLSGIANLIEQEGFKVRGVHELLPELLMPEGKAGSIAPSAADEEDIRTGFSIIHALDPYDVGQGVVVAGKRVLVIETAGGTAEMLTHLAELRERGKVKFAGRAGVLIKAPKPKQDRRIDLPAIGPETIEQAAKAGLRGIAVEAGGTIIADASATAGAADRAGLFLAGYKSPDGSAR
jgi:UDP-2,3-diacylglucosamine hydrolase